MNFLLSKYTGESINVVARDIKKIFIMACLLLFFPFYSTFYFSFLLGSWRDLRDKKKGNFCLSPKTISVNLYKTNFIWCQISLVSIKCFGECPRNPSRIYSGYEMIREADIKRDGRNFSKDRLPCFSGRFI